MLEICEKLKNGIVGREIETKSILVAMEVGLKYVSKFERKDGLILTDGDWNRGGDPFQAAVLYDKLSVIGFPPAEHEKIRQLALQGKGSLSLVRDEREIAGAILRCLKQVEGSILAF